jgi:tetrapyrrole methylase family protein/MazG family protein
MSEFDELLQIVEKLRIECPWDKEQTHESLAKHLIEESYELLDAISKLDSTPESFNELKSELGDVLLQIFLHSKIAEEKKFFNMADVMISLREKLIKRHPHIFEDIQLESAEDVEKQWEKIKQKDSNSIFDDLNHSLPPVNIAFKAQRKAKSLKLSYSNYEKALEDLISEIEELKAANNIEDRKSELGDVYFSLLNVSRYLDADPEVQLKRSIDRFITRAKYVEEHYQEDDDMNLLWQEAKKNQIES